MTIAKIEDAIAALKRGGMVVVVDDEKRENEGDIIVASDSVTPQTIAFMMKNARGLICIAMQGERLDEMARHHDGLGVVAVGIQHHRLG